MKVEITGEYHEGDSGLSVKLASYIDISEWTIIFYYEEIRVEIDFSEGIAKLLTTSENGIKDYELSSADIDWKEDGFVVYSSGSPVIHVYAADKNDLIYQQMVKWLEEV